MSKKEIKLPLTPITENTFIRQGWNKHRVGDTLNITDDDVMDDTDDVMDDTDEVYYYTLSLPKERTDDYTPLLVSNATDETGLLKDMGLSVGTFFVEIMGTEGLGNCTTEEELEILYKVLTGENLENS
jgi:hypothetical protein